jgi:RNA 2',3'-cyclic 3'-phosphodiesterase
VSGSPEDFLAQNAALSSDSFEMYGFALFESHLGHGGARYEIIERYPLG